MHYRLRSVFGDYFVNQIIGIYCRILTSQSCLWCLKICLKATSATNFAEFHTFFTCAKCWSFTNWFHTVTHWWVHNKDEIQLGLKKWLMRILRKVLFNTRHPFITTTVVKFSKIKNVCGKLKIKLQNEDSSFSARFR